MRHGQVLRGNASVNAIDACDFNYMIDMINDIADRCYRRRRQPQGHFGPPTAQRGADADADCVRARAAEVSPRIGASEMA